MIDTMTITNAQYIFENDSNSENGSIKATINGKSYTVPLDSDNAHYAEIMRQVNAGTLTIADAS